MTVEYSGKDISMVAAEDLSAHQFCYVHQATDTTVDLLDSTSELPFGILQNAPEDGETAVVRIEGTSKLVMNAAIAVSTWVINDLSTWGAITWSGRYAVFCSAP